MTNALPLRRVWSVTTARWNAVEARRPNLVVLGARGEGYRLLVYLTVHQRQQIQFQFQFQFDQHVHSSLDQTSTTNALPLRRVWSVTTARWNAVERSSRRSYFVVLRARGKRYRSSGNVLYPVHQKLQSTIVFNRSSF